MQHVQMTEAQQIANAKAVRARMLNPPANSNSDRRAHLKEIADLKQQVAGFTKMMKEYEEDAIKAEFDRADYQAIILSQTQRICELEGVKFNGKEMRRTVREIVAEVLEEFPGITWKMLVSHDRRKHLIMPRHMAMYVVHKERDDISFPKLGRIFGGRDHSSCLYAVKKIEAMQNAEA